MLDAERNADNGNTEHHPKGKVKHRYFNSAHQDPYHIHYDRKTAAVIGIGLDVVSERPEGKAGQLYELKAERYAYDGDAEQKSYDKVINADDESAQQEPEDISS